MNKHTHLDKYAMLLLKEIFDAFTMRKMGVLQLVLQSAFF
jgi:hypothetical protein